MPPPPFQDTVQDHIFTYVTRNVLPSFYLLTIYYYKKGPTLHVTSNQILTLRSTCWYHSHSHRITSCYLFNGIPLSKPDYMNRRIETHCKLSCRSTITIRHQRMWFVTLLVNYSAPPCIKKHTNLLSHKHRHFGLLSRPAHWILKKKNSFATLSPRRFCKYALITNCSRFVSLAIDIAHITPGLDLRQKDTYTHSLFYALSQFDPTSWNLPRRRIFLSSTKRMNRNWNELEKCGLATRSFRLQILASISSLLCFVFLGLS